VGGSEAVRRGKGRRAREGKKSWRRVEARVVEHGGCGGGVDESIAGRAKDWRWLMEEKRAVFVESSSLFFPQARRYPPD
jgi:hypothetical protein